MQLTNSCRRNIQAAVGWLLHNFLQDFMVRFDRSVPCWFSGWRTLSITTKDQPESIPTRTQLLQSQCNRRQIGSFHIQCRESWKVAQIQNINHIWELQKHKSKTFNILFSVVQCISHNPLTHTTCSSAVKASPMLNWSWCSSLTGSGQVPLCSSSSTGSCCSHTPSCRRAARWARCRTRWRCRWAGRTPAAWGAGPSRAAPRTCCPSPSSAPRCMWQNGTGRTFVHKTHLRQHNNVMEESQEKRSIKEESYQLKEANPDRWLLRLSLTSVWNRGQSVFMWTFICNISLLLSFTHFSLSLDAVMVLHGSKQKTLWAAVLKHKPDDLLLTEYYQFNINNLFSTVTLRDQRSATWCK